MTALLIFLGIGQLTILIYFIVIFIRTFIKYRPSQFDSYRRNRPSEIIVTIIEVMSTIIAPIVGFLRLNTISSGEIPFEPDHQLILIILISIAVTAFWISKLGKGKLSPMLDAFAPIGILLGIVLALVMTTHFAPFTVLAILFPIAGFELVATFIVLLAFIRELYLNHLIFRLKYYPSRINDDFANHRLFKTFLQSKFNKKFPIFFFFSFFIIAIMQAFVTLFGQAPDSLIRVFYESCGFILSESQHCYSGGHYLCTVAAHGDKKLVKPIRYGERNKKRILVNRQLLVANAFENWLEDNCPKTQIKLRKFYDSLNIPVKVWARKKRIANIIYLIMKPLEWAFIFWLYLFDQNPETRIARQYLPIDKNKVK